ncbi:hypothetical protein OHB36_37655 [Streptomyces sp. NBC_00320]|uniref:hypothetical protein n=1 Tax=Streptomyces sp. NBC_00320 TaxID=2975711 RepID=UPI00225B5DC3|nr:hypothetical protein [Streptomyces sp. NBC_00320]MCX5152384.1 hypothetical protein [Streptomyces sp. NBC_00320]
MSRTTTWSCGAETAGPTVGYVHSSGNKVRYGLLKSRWTQALFDRDTRSASRMAYWAPLPDQSDPNLSACGSPLSVEASVRVLSGADVPQTPKAFVERTLREALTDAGNRT